MSKLAHAGARSTVSPAVAIAAAVATASSSARTRSTGTPAGASAAAIRSRAAPNRIARRTFPLALATSGSYAPPLSTPPASRITRPGNESRLFAAAPTLVAFESSYQRTPSRSRTTVSRCGSGSTASIVACTASAGAPASRAVATAARMFSTLWRPASRVRPRSYRSSPPSGARNAAKPSPAKAPHGTAAAPNETTRERTPATARHASGSSRFTTAQSSAPCAAKSRAFVSRYSANVPWRSRWSGVRLRRHPTRGRKRSTHSSWKLDTSTTAISGGSSSAAINGVPRLPPVKVRRPARASARPTSVVVVLLPFVPVMATTGHDSMRKASSISLHTGIPRRTAAASSAASRGTPGLGTTRSMSRSRSGPSSPSRSSTPAGTRGAPLAAGRASATRTRAPRCASAAATASPVRRKPTTRTCRPGSIAASAELQRREREQRTDDRDDPEADDDLRLGPAEELEVVVDRRHAEDALPPQLERHHLADHRQRLDDEDAADDQQHELLARDERDDPERRAECERADVAHEHLRRVGVEPEEAEARRRERAAEDRELARARDVRDLEVLGDLRVARGVGEDRVRPARDHDGSDREPVEPVGQVDGVRRADDDDRAEGDVPEPQIRVHVLQEGHREMPAVLGHEVDPRRREPRDRELEEKANPTRDPGRAPSPYLRVVVEEADQAVADGDEQRDPDVDVVQVGEEYRREHEREDDEHAAHRRRAGLGGVVRWTVAADRLPDLERREPPDERRPEEERARERGEAGQKRPEGDVLEDVQRGVCDVQRIEEEIEHHGTGAPPAACKWRRTSSIAAPRDPLRRTRSPARHIPRRCAPSSAWSAATKIRSPGRPAASAPARTSAACSPRRRSASTRTSAARAPSSRCARADSAPSSRISPRTAMRRRPRLAASVRSAAVIDAGFAL